MFHDVGMVQRFGPHCRRKKDTITIIIIIIIVVVLVFEIIVIAFHHHHHRRRRRHLLLHLLFLLLPVVVSFVGIIACARLWTGRPHDVNSPHCLTGRRVRNESTH